MTSRGRALRPTVKGAISEQTELDLRAALDGSNYDVLSASTSLRLVAASQLVSPTPSAWLRPLGPRTKRLEKLRAAGGIEHFQVHAKARTRAKDGRQATERSAELAAVVRKTEFTPSIRLLGNGREAFCTNVRQMRRGDL